MKVQAQAPRGGNDTIFFLAATRGYDLNNNGLHEWCWVKQDTGEVWHGRFQNGLDEVPQTGQYQPPPTDPAVYCPSNWTEKVDLTTYGITDVSDCTAAFPCVSLRAIGKTGTYTTDGCDFIEVDFYDRATWSDSTGDWKGKQRMLHTAAPSGPGSSFSLPDVMVTSLGWYSTTEIGTVTPNWACNGFTNYHVHHDFMQPTGSQYCVLGKNDNLLQLNANWQKENSSHWVHSMVHEIGRAHV